MGEDNKTTKEAIDQILDAVKILTNQAIDSAQSAAKSVKDKIDNDPTISGAVNHVQEAAKKASQTVKDTFGKLDGPEIRTHIQYDGKEVTERDIIENVAALYIEEGHTADSIKEIDIYIKPEEDTVYYVINGTDTGKILI